MTVTGAGPRTAATEGVRGLDPALPHLADALAAREPGWQLHDVTWTPGERCVITYRVPGSDGRRPDFVALELTPAGSVLHHLLDDTALRGLAATVDGSAVTELLRDVGTDAWHVDTEPVRYRPGSRCVLRVQAATTAGVTPMYAKVVAAPADGAALAVPLALARAGEHRFGLVPTLVGARPDLGLLLHAAVPGRALSTVLVDPSVPSATRVRMAYRLGALLARLHASDVPAPRRTAVEAVDSAARSLTAAHRADPATGERLTTALERLAVSPPSAIREVLGHGGFRCGQAVFGSTGLTLLDLDGACRCDAGRDLGTALAHLGWQRVLHPQESTTLEGAERALLAGYERRAGPVDDAILRWWRALGLVQVAGRRYRRLEVDRWGQVGRFLDGLEDLLATPQGLPLPDHLLQPRSMTRTLRPLLAPVASTPDELVVTSAQLLQDAPGRRRVVCYTVRGLEGRTPTQIVGKVFSDPKRAELADRNGRTLAAGPFRTGLLRVPEPLPSAASSGLVLSRRARGVPLRAMRGTEAVRGCAAAAGWLAQLHRSGVVLDRRLDLTAEAASCVAWAVVVATACPDLERPSRLLAERWHKAADSHPREGGDSGEYGDPHGPAVPLHKDFHAGHVLIGDEVCTVDLDEARMGDPAFDVAHFCTYLELGQDRQQADVRRRAFLAAYRAATGWDDPQGLALFTAYTWLKIAKQLSSGTGPYRLPTNPARDRAVRRAIESGAACLNA